MVGSIDEAETSIEVCVHVCEEGRRERREGESRGGREEMKRGKNKVEPKRGGEGITCQSLSHWLIPCHAHW